MSTTSLLLVWWSAAFAVWAAADLLASRRRRRINPADCLSATEYAAVKSVGIASLIWFVVFTVWSLVMSGPTIATDRQWLMGFINAGLFTGLPLLVTVPLLQVPVFRRAVRNLHGVTARVCAMPFIGLLSALPLVVWPDGILSGNLPALLTGNLEAAGDLVDVIDPRDAWPYYALYGTFGVALASWYALLCAAPSSNAQVARS